MQKEYLRKHPQLHIAEKIFWLLTINIFWRSTSPSTSPAWHHDIPRTHKQTPRRESIPHSTIFSGIRTRWLGDLSLTDRPRYYTSIFMFCSLLLQTSLCFTPASLSSHLGNRNTKYPSFLTDIALFVALSISVSLTLFIPLNLSWPLDHGNYFSLVWVISQRMVWFSIGDDFGFISGHRGLILSTCFSFGCNFMCGVWFAASAIWHCWLIVDCSFGLLFRCLRWVFNA